MKKGSPSIRGGKKRFPLFQEPFLPWLLGLGMLFAAAPALTQTVEVNFQFLVGLLLFPLLLKTHRPGETSLRYVWLAGLCLAGFFLLEIRSLLLIALGAAILLIYEVFRGKTSWAPLAVLLLMSPVSMYLSRVLTFSLRLKMSAVAGRVFELMQLPVEVQGNFFRVSGEGFSVDPECLGLHSMITGLYLVIIVLSLTRPKGHPPLKASWSLALLLLGCLLQLFVNQIRIISLVWLKAPAGDWTHDAIGLMCLVLYGCV
ncbi:MAG: archaeosortase/exosortase family protein, partial [Bacteroidota bacterium]